jgi:hypothetical protein
MIQVKLKSGKEFVPFYENSVDKDGFSLFFTTKGHKGFTK